MQNVFNLISPFFDPVSGNPLVGGRVTFVEPQNDNQTVLIHVFDKDHNEIQNPLPLNDMGVFEIQPFVEDGIEYKMLVERATGLDDPQWELVYTMDSKTQKLSVEYSGAAVAASIDELRSVNPEVGSCVVLGYSSADDFCPSRIFRWVQEPYSENYGTRIKSAVEGYANQGTWVYEPSGFVDVRTFGINNDNDPAVDLFQGLSRIKASHPNLPVYFPPSANNYLLASSIDLNSVIMDRGVKISPHPDVGNSVQLGIGWLENRGGKFCATQQDSPTAPRVIPKLNGLLKTSWLQGTLTEFLTESALDKLYIIDFDRVETEQSQGSTRVDIEGKILKNFQNLYEPPSVDGSVYWKNCIALNDAMATEISKLRASDHIDVGKFFFKAFNNGNGLGRLPPGADWDEDDIDVENSWIYFRHDPSDLIIIRKIIDFRASATFANLYADYIGVGANTSISEAKVHTPLVEAAEFAIGKFTGVLCVRHIDVSLTGDGTSGKEIVGEEITLLDGEEFFVRIKFNIEEASSGTTGHQFTYRFPIKSSNLELVVSNDDIVARKGNLLAIGLRSGDEFFFNYNTDLFSVNGGVFVRTRQ